MNAGFSNLLGLKKHLLATSQQSGTAYDTPITDLGLGIAAMIERYCGRQFLRIVADTAILAADQIQFLLPRFPLESISAIDLKVSESAGWVAQTVNDFIKTIGLAEGIVYLPEGADPGDYSTQVRFTYTGGYFWNILEPTDNSYPTALPAGATALPADLKLAWLLQCRAVWNSFDKLGVNVAAPDDGSVGRALAELELSPQVKLMLNQFRRDQMV